MKKLLLALLVLGGLALVVGWQTGHVGKLIGTARVHLMPSDPGLLAFFPREADTAVVVQAPLLSPLPASEKVAAQLRDLASSVDETAGVRLLLDVDALAFDGTLQVARGRFAWQRMSERLTAAGYEVAVDEGTPIAIKASTGDAVAVVGDYALHGKADVVSAAVARQGKAEGVPTDGAVNALFRHVGWSHGVVGVHKLADRPDLSQVLAGNVQPQAVAVALDRGELATQIAVLVQAGTEAQAVSIGDEVKNVRQRALEELKGDEALARELRQTVAGTSVDVDGRDVVVRLSVSDQLVALLTDGAGDAAKLYQGKALALGALLGSLGH